MCLNERTPANGAGRKMLDAAEECAAFRRRLKFCARWTLVQPLLLDVVLLACKHLLLWPNNSHGWRSAANTLPNVQISERKSLCKRILICDYADRFRICDSQIASRSRSRLLLLLEKCTAREQLMSSTSHTLNTWKQWQLQSRSAGPDRRTDRTADRQSVDDF